MTERGADIIERLRKVFLRVGEMDQAVGDVWLHPKQIQELHASRDPGWDRIHSGFVMTMNLETRGGLYIGMLWGAQVYQSEVVPEDHCAVVPRGFEAKLVSPEGCRLF